MPRGSPGCQGLGKGEIETNQVSGVPESIVIGMGWNLKIIGIAWKHHGKWWRVNWERGCTIATSVSALHV